MQHGNSAEFSKGVDTRAHPSYSYLEVFVTHMGDEVQSSRIQANSPRPGALGSPVSDLPVRPPPGRHLQSGDRRAQDLEIQIWR